MSSAYLKIKTGKCNLCGAVGSLVKGEDFKRCKTCCPELYEEVAQKEKTAWLNGK